MKWHWSVIVGLMLAKMAFADMRSLQGQSFVDLTREDASLDLNVTDGGRIDMKCGLVLRSNQPFPSSKGFNLLKEMLKVEERGSGELTGSVSAMSLTYTYTSHSDFGTQVRIATKGGETLVRAIEAAFDKQEEEAPRVVVTLIPCTR